MKESFIQKKVCIFLTVKSIQSSLERIHWLPHIVHNWKGPLSLAVHVTSEEEWLILNLYTRFLERCYPSFRDQVSMHLAVPANIGPFCFDQDKIYEWTNASTVAAAASSHWPRHNRQNNVLSHGPHKFNIEEVLHSPENQECDRTRDYMTYLLQAFPITQKEKLRFKEVYPQNHMRNIARKVSFFI